MRTRDIMMCFMFDEVKTRAAVDDEGYLHSGDVGSLSGRWNLPKITGRMCSVSIVCIVRVWCVNYLILANYLIVGRRCALSTDHSSGKTFP